MALSGTQWYTVVNGEVFFSNQNLGENLTTGEGGVSLRQAWQTSTANYNNTIAATSDKEATQYHYANEIFSLGGTVAGEESRQVGFIDLKSYTKNDSWLPAEPSNLVHVVTGQFNVLCNSVCAIILGSTDKGTFSIQHDALNSFYRVDDLSLIHI